MQTPVDIPEGVRVTTMHRADAPIGRTAPARAEHSRHPDGGLIGWWQTAVGRSTKADETRRWANSRRIMRS